MLTLECGALIDEADLPLIAGLRPYRQTRGGYVFVRVNGVRHPLHRYLLDARPGDVVDHINGNPTDNRRENLRFCSHAENMQNRRMHTNNATGFKGVYFDPRRQTYRAQVVAFKKKHCLGSFDRAEDAHEAYRAKAAELHGEFFRRGSAPRS